MTRHLLVIGAQRCGTTYLSAMLEAHPDIVMAQPARPEPKVFMSDDLVARGLDCYHAAYFSHRTSESLLGEKSTSYLEDAAAAGRAAAMLGPTEIVVQLRDPVARAVSNWRFSSKHGLENRSLDRALDETLEGPRPWDPNVSSVSPFAYLERGRYIDYLEPWYACFPDTVHVRFLEDVTAHRTSASDLYGEVGVDPGFQPPAEGHRVNESEGTAPDLDEALVRRLRDYFRESDLRLTQRLGRPLPWPSG